MKKTVLVLALVMICAIRSFSQQKAPTPTPSYGTFAFTDEVRLAVLSIASMMLLRVTSPVGGTTHSQRNRTVCTSSQNRAGDSMRSSPRTVTGCCMRL